MRYLHVYVFTSLVLYFHAIFLKIISIAFFVSTGKFNVVN